MLNWPNPDVRTLSPGDKVFNKATFPNHDITSYPHTPFYNLVREWIKN